MAKGKRLYRNAKLWFVIFSLGLIFKDKGQMSGMAEKKSSLPVPSPLTLIGKIALQSPSFTLDTESAKSISDNVIGQIVPKIGEISSKFEIGNVTLSEQSVKKVAETLIKSEFQENNVKLYDA